jgi:putative tryptophan/tyrosine transport system substrate-binding protein
MRRRDFVTFLGGAMSWVATGRAQEPRRLIGVLGSAPIPESEVAFIQGLKAAGFLEGENISIERRWADGQYDRLPSLAAELLSRHVAVIAAFDVPAAIAAKAATKTTPIVFLTGADPVGLGLVESLNQPRGNLTGVAHLLSSLGPKQLELLHELLPGFSKVALLVNPKNQNTRIDAPELQATADALGQNLEVLRASTENELDTAYATMVQKQIGALVVKADPFFIEQRERLVALSARYGIAAIYSLTVFVKVGGLMSYGGNLLESYQTEGTYTGKILRGAKPADLPIHQSTKFELVINLKTAKALGLGVPPSLLIRADEVIE